MIDKPQGQPATSPPTAWDDALDLHDGLWRLMGRALDWLTRFVPAAAATYFGIDGQRRVSIAEPFVYKLSPSDLFDMQRAYQAYVDAYWELDPLTSSAFASGRSVVGVDDVGGLQAYAQSRFGREFLAPLGLGPTSTILLRGETRAVAAIVLSRRVGDAPPSSVQLEFLRRSQPLLQDAHLVAQRAEGPDPDELLRSSGLTAREIEVALLVASGATNEEIARTLTVTEATVKTHLHRTFTKLGVRSRTQLALQLGARATFG